MNRKNIKVALAAAVLGIAVVASWCTLFAPTRIGYLNYSAISLGNTAFLNENPSIKLVEVDAEDLSKLSKLDMLFINGMGIRITEEQRAQIQGYADRGLPVLSSAVTNPANDINNIDSLKRVRIGEYMKASSNSNTVSLLNYIRKYIDGKVFRAYEPDEVVVTPHYSITYPNLESERGDRNGFNSVAEVNEFFKESGIYDESKPRIVVTGLMGTPDNLIRELTKSGNMVYYISSIKAMIDSGQIDSISPSAIINMAHGRMGDYIVDYAAEQNTPIFAPLNANTLVEKWEEDKMGMFGGMLSQSVVTPEIDGAIRPYVIYGHYIDQASGLQYASTIPERLDSFVETVNRYVTLRHKQNSEKKVVIYYYKGVGQSEMSAGGMEVAPSMFNVLKRLQAEGYNVDGLPANHRILGEMIQRQGAIFGSYAEGAQEQFIIDGKPEMITREQFEEWSQRTLKPEVIEEVKATNGEFPGRYMNSEGKLAVSRLQFGNIVLTPQNAAGAGGDSFEVVHGTDAVPPYPYIASYLWSQYGFEADVLIHFGTHGSLEFTPKKQVALSSYDWPDRLVGTLPHFYIYTINNVGEGVIAKRRAYAGLQSHLTPPFLESSVRGIYRELDEAIRIYNNKSGCDDHDHDHADHDHAHEVDDRTSADILRAALAVKKATVKLGIHIDLKLDSVEMNKPYTPAEMLRIENFAEELATEKITGELYTMGVPYESQRIISSVYAMSTEPIAYSLMALDRLRGESVSGADHHKMLFTSKYLEPSKALVGRILAKPSIATDELICKTAGVTMKELELSRAVMRAQSATTDRSAMMNAMMAGGARPQGGAQGGGRPSMPKRVEYTKEQIAFARALSEVEKTISNVNNYKNALLGSPDIELASLINAMGGGYTKPSPGGDPVANPNTIPTGRNLYSVDAEATPSAVAWDKGIRLANNTIELYKSRNNGELPRKVSYTLWAGEFIETEGATIAQILYMLGVEPIRDTYGRVSDLRLIPSAELGRPRIDVVVQTSGQLRDLAASRLFLVNRAVEMAAEAKDDIFTNQVHEGVVEAERTLIERGVTPKDARAMASYRVFGGANGMYGTGIQGMVMSSDRWDDVDQIAEVYINNVGAFYGSEKSWEAFKEYAFEAALTRTDVVIQPRQSNTWGALSLDHVYEFMGGLNAAVRKVTGKDPDAYLSDYRNRNNVKMQELQEAIGIESRTTIFNPTYIKEKMKGEAGSAGVFAATFQNTFAWNALKPDVIDDQIWNEAHDIYVKDRFELGIKEFFERENHSALQEVTAVMMEAIRKEMWDATPEQRRELAELHTELVNKHLPSCSGFVCNNASLREFIAENAPAEAAKDYKAKISKIRTASRDMKPQEQQQDNSMVMKKEELSSANATSQVEIVGGAVVGVVLLILIGAVILVIRRRSRSQQL